MSAPVQPIIIIKRKRSAHAGHHGGAWKVAYADFVTAMMALFIVLWLLSSSEQVQKAVGGYFTDPNGHGKDVGNGLKGTGSESLAVKKDDMTKLKDKLEQAIKDTSSLQKIKEHVIFTVTTEGLRVELLEDESGTFFESGSPIPTGAGKDLLAKLAEEIGKLPNRITMEGHTDAKPYAGRPDYSNWELSSDRANAARRWMQEKGMRQDQVAQVRGFADQSLRIPTNAEDPKNRRITVIILYARTAAAEAEDKAKAEADEKAKAEADEKAKSEAAKPGETKPGEAPKTTAEKPAAATESKTAQSKTAETAPESPLAESKPAENTRAENKPAEAKAKAPAPRPGNGKPSAFSLLDPVTKLFGKK